MLLERQKGLENRALSDMAGELLGQIITYYLLLLDYHIRYLDDGDTRFLFLTRAGVRILDVYRRHLHARGKALPSSVRIGLSSRLLTCKGVSSRLRDEAVNCMGREFANVALKDTLRALLKPLLQEEGLASLSFDVEAEALHKFLDGESHLAGVANAHLAEQAELFEEYFNSETEGCSRVVLIDTGWEGTTQRLLARAFPSKSYIGLYFGWMGLEPWNDANGIVRGLIFNASEYNPGRPETAFSLHRHLIESLFEPNAPSVDHLVRDPATGRVVAPGMDALVNERWDELTDPLFAKVCDYVQSSGSSKLGAHVANYRAAMRVFASKLAYPSRDDAKVLEGKPRSADFGRDVEVPVLIRNRDDVRPEAIASRISSSLWPQGQMAVEYEPDVARVQQARHVGKVEPEQFSSPRRARASTGRVAIVTRTKDRPILLRRASESVARQTFKDYVWVIVNDGGEPNAVDQIILESAVPPHQIVICNNAESVGMEAASNIGAKAAESEYIVIHDDDDAWAPEFLRSTVEFLDSVEGLKYGGVITHSQYVSEEIVGSQVIEHGRWPYQDWVRHVQLAELAVENFFPPIAFLFRRSVYDEIRGFDEGLPVLGDWDFALRFLLRADIGVISVPLAYYHHRDRGSSDSYSNSVIGGVSKHIEYNAIVRNKYLRLGATDLRFASLANLMAQGYVHRDLRNRVNHGAVAGSQEQVSSGGRVQFSDEVWCMLQALTHGKWILLNSVDAIRLRARKDTYGRVLLRRAMRTPLKPPADFDDEAYLSVHPDVAQSVARGEFASGYDHFMKHGRFEGRSRTSRRRDG